MKIGLAIRALRHERQLTLQALAVKANTTASTLSRIETEADKKVSLECAILVSKALDVTLYQLVALAEALDTPELDCAYRRSATAKSDIKLLSEAGKKLIKNFQRKQ